MFRQAPSVALGPGDDCAAVRTNGEYFQLFAADQLAEGLHYLKSSTTPEKVGAKLLKRNLSDIAAMGGLPEYALITAAATYSETEFIRFFQGIENTAEKYGVSIIGGDISGNTGKDLFSLTITGKVSENKICPRSGAKPGDRIFVTGSLGNSFHSGHHLNFTPRLAEAAFLAGEYTRAMIDISDGFLADLGHVMSSSGIGAVVTAERLPLRAGSGFEGALSDGEDYELIIAVPQAKAKKLKKEWPFKETPLTEIGFFTEKHSGFAYNADGVNLSRKFKKGYDHFD
jgi:thiamine-monophosphate kinase